MLQRKSINVLLSNLGWGSILAPSNGSSWVVVASYLIIIQIFLFSSSVLLRKGYRSLLAHGRVCANLSRASSWSTAPHLPRNEQNLPLIRRMVALRTAARRDDVLRVSTLPLCGVLRLSHYSNFTFHMCLQAEIYTSTKVK